MINETDDHSKKKRTQVVSQLQRAMIARVKERSSMTDVGYASVCKSDVDNALVAALELLERGY